MRELIRLLVFLGIVASGVVLGRFVWAKYLLGKKDVTLEQIVTQTRKDVISKAGELDKGLGKILGESETREGVGVYVKEELPQKIQEQVQKSEVVKQLQSEVGRIVQQTVGSTKDLPQTEFKKIKRGVEQEICNQLLEKNQ